MPVEQMRIKSLLMAVAMLFWYHTAQAATLSHVAAGEPPERFMSVTAENGREWLEQCEWPAQKSDSMARIAACLSFLQGAKTFSSKRDPSMACSTQISVQSRGTLLTTTYQIARRYPNMPITKIFRIAFDSVEPAAC